MNMNLRVRVIDLLILIFCVCCAKQNKNSCSKGIGLATVRALRANGFAKVIVASRSPPPADVMDDTGVEFVRADLSLLANADTLAAELGKLVDRFDLLVLNAGVGLPDFARKMTSDNLNMMFALNHVVQARLLDRLSPMLQRSPLNRVVFVSSGSSHEATAESLKAPIIGNSPPANLAYGISKAYQVEFLIIIIIMWLFSDLFLKL